MWFENQQKMEQYTEEELTSNKEPFLDKTAGIKDWSTVHSNTGSLHKTPENAAEWKKFCLAEKQVMFYKENGFLANIKLLTEKECDKLLAEYRKILDLQDNSNERKLFYEYHRNQTQDPNNVLMHALGHWRVYRHFHDLPFHPAVTVPASQLIRPDHTRHNKVRFWHDQLFAKPARHGGVVAWHQDYSYWTRTVPMEHLTIHIALEEQTLENGCIHYIPKSHKWTRNGNPLPVTDFNFKDMESIKTILNEEEKAMFKPVPCLLKKGEASFHHPLAVHGSYQNKSNLPRRAAVINYFADGVKSNSDELLLDGTFIIKQGKPMRGQFYPVVFDPECLND